MFTRNGSFVGFTSSSDGWLQRIPPKTVSNVQAFHGEESQLQIETFDSPILINEGETVSFYLHTSQSSSFLYAGGGQPSPWRDLEDDYLTLMSGNYNSGSPFNSIQDCRKFVGKIGMWYHIINHLFPSFHFISFP